MHGLFGVAKPGYRSGPAWTSAISHPLIVAVGLGLAVALWLARRRGAGARGIGATGGTVSERDALLALALVLLLRCVLDTWDTAYYALPFVLTLLVWEASGTGVRPPVLALTCTVLAWGSYQWLPAQGMTPDGQAAMFLAWTVPLAVGLALALYAPATARRIAAVASTVGLGARARGLRLRRSARWAARSGSRSRCRATSDELLDAHAELAREVDAGLDRDDVARQQRIVPGVRDRRGPSWISMPTPWPSPWPKCSPWPACSMTARAARIDLAPAGAGAAARPAPGCWAARTSS